MTTPSRPLRPWPALAAVGTALALAACGSDASSEEDSAAADERQVDPDSIEWRNGPVPDTEPGVPAQELSDLLPESGSEMDENLGARATHDLTRVAGVVDEDSSWECPEFEHVEGEEFTCSVTFLGEDFDYHVTIGEVGDYTTQYQNELSEKPVVREYVEDSIRFGSGSEDVRCEMDEVIRVPQDATDPYDIECHALEDGEAQEWQVVPHFQGGTNVGPAY